MARTIANIVDFIQYLVKKQRGVFLTPAECTANLNTGQLDAVEEWFAPYGETQILHDALRQLRIYQPYTSDAAGFVTFPDNYIHLLGQPFTVAGSTVNRVEFVNEDELPFALTSQLRPVSNSYPIAVDSATGFSIYPQQTQTGAYFYIRIPNAPVYDYTQVGRVITYNPAGSTQLEFSDVYVNNILAKSLRYAGINMSEKEISDFANQYNAETK